MTGSKRREISEGNITKVLASLDRGVSLQVLAKKYNVSLAYMADVKIMRGLPSATAEPLSEYGVKLKKRLVFSRAYDAANKDKIKSRSALQHAVRRGDLIRPVICSECKLNKLTEGHHDDYSKPLDGQ